MPSVYIKTYGCQMNERDSEAVAAQLVAKGYTLAPSEAMADVILLNTCSVRDLAEQKALNKMVNVIAETRRNRPGAVLGFMGCMAQSRGQELIDRLPDVDLVLGTQKFHRAADYLDELIAGRREKIVDVAAEQGSEATIREHLLYGNTASNGDGHRPPLQVAAFVSIMQGCNQYCTFCIVPYTRGEERSRTIPDIVAECRQLVSQGVKEITLLGQIVDRYGKERPDYPSLAGLLRELNEIEGVERLRFLTSHPNWLNDDLLDAVAELPRVMPHLEVPAQAGDDQVLANMRRGYTNDDYRRLVDRIRQRIPNASIATDIIVGFPGEGEAQFKKTYDLLADLKLDVAHLARYSPRPGTVADRHMPDDVPDEEKWSRFRQLEDLQEAILTEKHAAYLGQTFPILFENKVKKRWRGRTPTNKLVFVESDDSLSGQIRPVKINWSGPWSMIGELADQPNLNG